MEREEFASFYAASFQRLLHLHQQRLHQSAARRRKRHRDPAASTEVIPFRPGPALTNAGPGRLWSSGGLCYQIELVAGGSASVVHRTPFSSRSASRLAPSPTTRSASAARSAVDQVNVRAVLCFLGLGDLVEHPGSAGRRFLRRAR